MNYYGQGLDALGTKIERGLVAVAEAIKAKARQPVYNVTVQAGSTGSPEELAEAVAKAIKRIESRV